MYAFVAVPNVVGFIFDSILVGLGTQWTLMSMGRKSESRRADPSAEAEGVCNKPPVSTSRPVAEERNRSGDAAHVNSGYTNPQCMNCVGRYYLRP